MFLVYHVFKHVQIVRRMVLIERLHFLKHIGLLTDFLHVVDRGVVGRHLELLRVVAAVVVFVLAVMSLTLLVLQHGHELLHQRIRSVSQVLSEPILERSFLCTLTFAIAVRLSWLLLFL